METTSIFGSKGNKIFIFKHQKFEILRKIEVFFIVKHQITMELQGIVVLKKALKCKLIQMHFGKHFSNGRDVCFVEPYSF